MSYDTTHPRPVVPALGPLYAKVSRLSYPLIRAAAGLMLMPHGAQKLFGWFGGYVLDGTGGFFAQNLGLEPGLFWAALVGAVEFSARRTGRRSGAALGGGCDVCR